MKNKALITYTITIAVLSLVSVTLVILDFVNVIDVFSYPFNIIDYIITFIFLIDYIYRFVYSKNKKNFFLKNIFDLIAVLPIQPILMFTRLSGFTSIAAIAKLCNIAKIIRLVHILRFASRLRRKTGRFLHTNGFIYVLYSAFGFILFSSVLISIIEQWSFNDSVWFSFVTCATVGYGDMVPASSAGKIIAIILMLFGVSVLGMLTGTITTYFSKKAQNKKIVHKKNLSTLIEASSCLSNQDISLLTSIAKTMAQGKFEISIKPDIE